MRTSTLPFLILITFWLGGIETANKPQPSKPGALLGEVKNTQQGLVTPVETGKKSTDKNDHGVHLVFDHFVIAIDSLEVWDKDEKLKKNQTDTATVYLEVGENIEGKTLRILHQKEGEINIYQRFENSIMVMNEGPHCDLTEWKHYHSEWEQLPLNNGKFITERYSEKDRQQFINVTMNELREAVKNQCGESWAELLKNTKSPTEYPSGVSISRIFLKIDFRSAKNDLIQEKTICFVIPMGC